MPRRYPNDIRRRVVELACSGTKVAQKQAEAVRVALGVPPEEVPIVQTICFVAADWSLWATPIQFDAVQVLWPRGARQADAARRPHQPLCDPGDRASACACSATDSSRPEKRRRTRLLSRPTETRSRVNTIRAFPASLAHLTHGAKSSRLKWCNALARRRDAQAGWRARTSSRGDSRSSSSTWRSASDSAER